MHRLPTLFICLLLASSSSSQIVINEVGIAPTSGVGEFIELYNRDGCSVDLSCYTLVFSSTSATGGNPTGWTIKIPSGKTVAAGGYFLIGGTAGMAGVSGGTGYPTGGSPTPYLGTADFDVGTIPVTANAVYMRQFVAAGTLPNGSGQLTLLDASGAVVTTVSYNSGNNPGTYPLSAYTNCGPSGNTQGTGNIADPGLSSNNVMGMFSAAGNQGIFLSASGTYQIETSLTPRASNSGNGGTQICSGPILNSITNVAVCFSSAVQTAAPLYTATGLPTLYSITWSATPANSLPVINNAALVAGSIAQFSIPANTAAGVYTGYLTLANACGKSCTTVFTLTVNARPAVNAGTYAPVCKNGLPVNLSGTPAGGSFSGTGVTGFQFTPPTTPGTYFVYYSYADPATGCTNGASAPIVVSAPGSSFATLCTTTSPYLFFGQPLNATGLHTVLVNNANGCTDTARAYLVITRFETVDTAACDSLVYLGVKYTTNTTITYPISSAVAGCDSIVRTVNITINKSSSSFSSACAGTGQTLLWNGLSLTSSGNYSATLTNAKGCDSVAKLFLVVTTRQSSALSGCNNVVYNGVSYTTSTTVYDTVKSTVTNCDSIIKEVNILVGGVQSTYLTQCANDGDVVVFNGASITSSGLYTANLTTPSGCDSVVRLYVVFKKDRMQTVTGCDSVRVNTNTYYSSTVVRDTLRSIISGCDSLITETTVIVHAAKTTQATACVSSGSSYNFFGQMLTAGGTYSHTLTTTAGCDSVIKLYLVITQAQSTTLSSCDSVIYQGIIYHASMVVRDTVSSIVTSCDSLIRTVNIVIGAAMQTTANICLAAGQTYNFNGQLLNTTGHYTTTYTTSRCDSIVNLYLLVSYPQTQTIQGCGSVSFNGNIYTVSVIISDTVKSLLSNCDSVYRTTNILISQPPTSFKTACIKEGNVYNFNGQSLTTTGSYSTTYMLAGGCDSTVLLYLLVSKEQVQPISGCDSVVFNGNTYQSSVSLRDTIRGTITACDSIYRIVNIVILPRPVANISVCIAQGSTYNFNGQVLSVGGNYSTVYSRTGQCDSTVNLYLLVSSNTMQQLSGCDTVYYNGKQYTSSTTISDTLRSAVTGCDSIINIVILQVNKKPLLQTSGDITICKGQSTQLWAASLASLTWLGYGNTDSIYVTPVFTTTYTAVALDTTGCSSSSNVTVTVQDFQLNLTASPPSILSGQPVFLQTSSSTRYKITAWQPAAVFANATSKTQRIFADSTLHITAIGESSGGCKDTAYAIVSVTPLDDVYVPSGFTPNGDGRNEEVKVMGTGIKEIDFKIFNRWGGLVFFTTDKLKGWNGKCNGNLQPAGTYVFVLKVQKLNGVTVEKKGTITLLR